MDGVSRIERFPVGDLRVGLGGEIKKLKRERRGDCRASQLLFAAADDLRARASLDAPPARVAVVLGTALGGVEEGEKALAGDPSARRAAAALYDGRAREWAIRAALAEAEVGAADIDFVSAHGTATPLNDRVEAAVLRRVLDACAERIPVNAIKGALGHTMGAAATLEAIMCLLASREGVVPHTVGLEEHDPECELDFVVTAPRAVRPRVSLSTSLGFGGCNAALVLEGDAR